MPTIDKLEYDSKTCLFRIKLSNDDIYLISYEELEELTLSEGQNITISQFDKLTKYSNRQKALSLAISYAAKRFTCSHKLISYLLSKSYSKALSEEIVNILKDKNLFDDDLFIEEYIKSKSTYSLWSKKRICFELKRIGFSNSEIESNFKEDFYQIEEENVSKIIISKLNSTKTLDNKNKQKIFSNLYGKGFSADLINKKIKELI